MPPDEKYRSRRFRLALLFAAPAVCFLLLCGLALMVGKSIEGASEVLSAYSLASGSTLAGYGFTRSKFIAPPGAEDGQ